MLLWKGMMNITYNKRETHYSFMRLWKEKTMYRLTTRDGDVWIFDGLEEARKNQYIFGGKIEKNN